MTKRNRCAVGAAIIVLLLYSPRSSSGVSFCTGDCNGDDRVSVDELVAGIDVALGTGSVSACTNLDRSGEGLIQVDEVVAAVDLSLRGCSVEDLVFREVLRTPEERFANLPGFPFEPRYMQAGQIRIHYVDEGPADALPVLLLHGEPSWSYLYRKMIPTITAAGYRAIVPDLVGFGRSDKPADRSDYTYKRLVDWTRFVVAELDLQNITLFAQDWGGLVGLRLAAEDGDRFARIIAANTALPTGDDPPSQAFLNFVNFTQTIPTFPVGLIVDGGSASSLSAEVRAAYDAPFPDESFKAATRELPVLVPITPDDPASEANRRAWRALTQWQKPFLTAFSDGDPITAGGDLVFQQRVPGTKGQPHVTIMGAGHFLQEDAGAELGQLVVDFIEESQR